VSVIPFSQALRERTWSGHGESEGAGFMHDLMTGKGTRDDYVALVAQHYFVYEALEAAAATFASDAAAAPFISAQLTRMPALEADLEFLLGADWAQQITPLPTTERYVARIREIEAEGWSGGFVAHHYTRYLGDLSGGQAIGRLMKRHFGFETNGILFYLFDQIADPKAFKETYREQLDAAGWDPVERERVIDEVLYAYKLNTELFEDLSAAKAAA
jgi:heme oxygenase